MSEPELKEREVTEEERLKARAERQLKREAFKKILAEKVKGAGLARAAQAKKAKIDKMSLFFVCSHIVQIGLQVFILLKLYGKA